MSDHSLDYVTRKGATFSYDPKMQCEKFTSESLNNAKLYLVIKKDITNAQETPIISKTFSFGENPQVIDNSITTEFKFTNAETNRFENASTPTGYVEYQYSLTFEYSDGTTDLATSLTDPPKIIVYPSLRINNFDVEGEV